MKRTTNRSNKTLPVILRSALENLIQNASGEEITIDKFYSAVRKQMPGVERLTCINFLRNAPGGWFVAGRRGHKSRFLFGQAFEDYRASELRRREWRRANGIADNVIPTLRGKKSDSAVKSKDTTGKRVMVKVKGKVVSAVLV